MSSKEEKVTDILEGAIPGEEPEEEVEEVPDTSSPIVAEERLDEEPERWAAWARVCTALWGALLLTC